MGEVRYNYIDMSHSPMRNRTIFLGFIVLLVIALGFIFSQFLTTSAQTLTPEEQERKAQLEAELREVEKQIIEQEKIVNRTRAKRVSLEDEVDLLNAEIKRSEYLIQQKNLLIAQITDIINEKEQTLEQLQAKMNREEDSLAQIIRRRYQIDQLTLAEMVLGSQTLSEFFADVESFESVKSELQESFEELRGLQQATAAEKETLAEKQRSEIDVKVAKEQEQRTIEQKEAERQKVLAATRSQEMSYQQILEQRKQKAAQIRAALFQLRDVQAIPFGDAYTFAKEASGSTGVRPALILAVLQQESNLGQNVGTCNRPGDSLTWRDIMPGPGESWRDDQAAFLRVTKSLGISPDGQPLSCPIGGGWGGAMGPSQFIPTTWEEYASRIASSVGVSVPNPWEPRHAIHATAIYLADLGAAAGGYSAERSAACKYYSGRDCGLSSMDNTFYGDGVIQRARNIQETMIDPLEAV